jgi:hypothetical protein
MTRSVVPQGPWTSRLNWDLYATFDGEICVPFHLYVQQGNVHRSSAKAFPQFLQLPVELQLAILRSCDNASLFQLMHVSRRTRTEAEKLFWSDPETLVEINGDWILAGGFPGHHDYALDFLARVKQLELDFGVPTPLVHNLWEDNERQYARRPPPDERNRQMDNFWQVLQHRFPCVANVILSGRNGGYEADILPPPGLAEIAERGPIRLHVSISCLHQTAYYPERMTRVLWRRKLSHSGQPNEWEVITSDWTRICVLPPPKTFRGPVGAYCHINHHSGRLSQRKLALRILLIQAIEAYYLEDGQKSCICPYSGCGLVFKLPGQWATHAIDAGHDRDIEAPSEQLRVLFKKHIDGLARREQEFADASEKLRTEWGAEGSAQRMASEDAFLTQLQHDPLYTNAVPPRDSSIWLRYAGTMNDEPWFG